MKTSQLLLFASTFVKCQEAISLHVTLTKQTASGTAKYRATLTALLKNRGYSVRSVWVNNLKCT